MLLPAADIIAHDISLATDDGDTPSLGLWQQIASRASKLLVARRASGAPLDYGMPRRIPCIAKRPFRCEAGCLAKALREVLHQDESVDRREREAPA